LKLKEILLPENIAPILYAKTRDEALNELVELIIDKVDISKDDLVNTLIEREDQSPTAMSGGVAVPHGRFPELENFILAVGKSKVGIDFGGDDGKTNIFFLLLAPIDDTVNHLKVLARIARICRNSGLPEKIMPLDTTDEIFKKLMEEDENI
jgi:nitrogen PTS system EIIA component